MLPDTLAMAFVTLATVPLAAAVVAQTRTPDRRPPISLTAGSLTGGAHWQQWFLTAGATDADQFEAMRIDDPHALRQVVLDGHGFGLFYAELTREDVRTGKLLQPFDIGIDPGCAYYLNRPKDAPIRAKLQTFTGWILDEVANNPFA